MSATAPTHTVLHVLALRVLAVTRTVLLGLATFSLEAGNLPEVLPGP